jgi:hypothetical protein
VVVVHEIAQLEAAVGRYEAARVLSAEEFRDYLDAEAILEGHLFDAASGLAQRFEFARARDVLDQVVKLNQSLRTVAERGLASPQPDFGRLPAQARDAACGRILVVQGQIWTSYADEQLMAGHTREAVEYLKKSRECFEELAGLALPQSEFGLLAAALAATKIEFFEASLALRRGKYELAKDGFSNAYSHCGALLEDVEEAAKTADARMAAVIGEFQREFTDQFNYTHVMLNYADFFCQVQSGNCEDAVQCAGDAVALCESWLRSTISNDLPPQLRTLRQTELEFLRGWLAWARAEHAVENREWDACLEHVRQARRSWFRSTDLALRNALRGVMPPQYETANTEMLLLSTLRRCRSEQRLHEELSRVREEKRQIGNTIIHAQGGHYMEHESAFTFNAPVNANAIGPGAKGRAERVEQHVTGTTDLRQLADELVQLREVLLAGAQGEAEKATIEEIEHAETEARQGDESAVRRHLAATGRWALSVAEKLALTAASTAIKASLGA